MQPQGAARWDVPETVVGTDLPETVMLAGVSKHMVGVECVGPPICLFGQFRRFPASLNGTVRRRAIPAGPYFWILFMRKESQGGPMFQFAEGIAHGASLIRGRGALAGSLA